MSRISLVSIVSVTLVAIGAAYWINAREPKRPWPKPTPPPPASPIYHDVDEPVPSEAEVDQFIAGHYDRLEREVQAALDGDHAGRREAAFVFVLPELLQVEPQRVVALLARQEPGPKRDLLRTEITRIWASQDPRAAVSWMRTLDDQERHSSGRLAVATLEPSEPQSALMVAKELDLKREHPPGERVSAR